jgi:creatinine amidohydrolase
MPNGEIRLGKLTRREFREALERGEFGTAIIPTGSIEQHLEHLPMEHDIASATWISEEVARRLYPSVIVTVPMAVGISEHHMVHPGTVTAKPGSWLSVLFDAVDSLVRHGVKNVLILNGHGGNETPVYGILRQWQLYFQSLFPQSNVQFESYWNLSREDAEKICGGRVPGHAQEYETSTAYVTFPGQIRQEAMRDQEDRMPLDASLEKGEKLVEAAVSRTVTYVEEMIAGGHREIRPHVFSSEVGQ